MKNIGEYETTLLTPEKKVVMSRQAEEKMDRESEFMIVNKTILFYLKENSNYKLYAGANWCEKTVGEGEMVMVAPDIYFRHIRTNIKYNSVWACITGIDGWSKKERELWETLCFRIDNLPNIEKIIHDLMWHYV